MQHRVVVGEVDYALYVKQLSVRSVSRFRRRMSLDATVIVRNRGTMPRDLEEDRVCFAGRIDDGHAILILPIRSPRLYPAPSRLCRMLHFVRNATRAARRQGRKFNYLGCHHSTPAFLRDAAKLSMNALTCMRSSTIQAVSSALASCWK